MIFLSDYVYTTSVTES